MHIGHERNTRDQGEAVVVPFVQAASTLHGSPAVDGVPRRHQATVLMLGMMAVATYLYVLRSPGRGIETGPGRLGTHAGCGFLE